ncbi:hypothetical protein GGX14DRAFT_581071 [Mycena pura]|uniref:Uncharacterized protein n=1 Tax=Mycena pura TaxID=153505 RepID=A0AAD6UJI4_9AGAR|nr:hypothetical protein GGX14DRAFT_581071 [Mycena pura]
MCKTGSHRVPHPCRPLPVSPAACCKPPTRVTRSPLPAHALPKIRKLPVLPGARWTACCSIRRTLHPACYSLPARTLPKTIAHRSPPTTHPPLHMPVATLRHPPPPARFRLPAVCRPPSVLAARAHVRKTHCPSPAAQRTLNSGRTPHPAPRTLLAARMRVHCLRSPAACRVRLHAHASPRILSRPLPAAGPS